MKKPNSTSGHNVTYLEFVINDMKKVLSLNEVKDFEYKAKKIHNSLKILKKIVTNYNDSISFSQRDIFETEYKTYSQGFVPAICVFDGQLKEFPISTLQQDCSGFIAKDGVVFFNLTNLKVGNQAVGQAWLPNGVEVFVPKYAVNHSMNSTATHIISWALLYKKEIQKKTRIH